MGALSGLVFCFFGTQRVELVTESTRGVGVGKDRTRVRLRAEEAALDGDAFGGDETDHKGLQDEELGGPGSSFRAATPA